MSGGTPFSVSYNWNVNYEILPDATKCACDYYRRRNTGNNKWDKCPDCWFVSDALSPRLWKVTNLESKDGLVCHSDEWHIGGDEVSNTSWLVLRLGVLVTLLTIIDDILLRE